MSEQPSVSNTPSSSSSAGTFVGPSKNFNLTSFLCILIVFVALAFEMGKKSLISSTENNSSMETSWLVSMQTSSVSTIGLLILAISSFAYGNFLASLPLLLITLIQICKLIMQTTFKKQLTKYKLPEIYEKYNYGGNSLFALIMILLYFYCKKAFTGSEQDRKQANTISIFIILLAILYSFVNFMIINNILTFWLTEG